LNCIAFCSTALLKVPAAVHGAAAAAATMCDALPAVLLHCFRYLLQYKLGSGPNGVAEGLGEGRFTTLWVSQDLTNGQSVVLKVRLLLCLLH
jgi:hypothetical protein